MIVSALTGAAYGGGLAGLVCFFLVVFSSVRSLGDDA